MACRLGSAFITAGDGCLTPGLSDTDLEYEERTFDTLLLKYLLFLVSVHLLAIYYYYYIINHFIINIFTLQTNSDLSIYMYESNLNKFVNILNEMCLYVIIIMPRE